MKLMRDERGSATIETVIWLPFYVGLLALIYDATMLMVAQTELWSLSANASRQVALGQMTEAEAETHVESIGGTERDFTAHVAISGGTAVVAVIRPFDDVPGIGLLTSYPSVLRADAYYRMEPSI